MNPQITETSYQQKANKWLQAMTDSSEKQELEALMQDDHALKEAFYQGLSFGTGGLRGIMGLGTNRINKYTIGMTTHGYGKYLLEKYNNEPIHIAIAYDSRQNSSYLANIAAAVFSSLGIHVHIFEELRPTPLLSFAIRHLECQGGVVVTASHNPKEYNGYKVYGADGAQLISPDDQQVINHVNAIQDLSQVNFEPDQAFIHSIKQEVEEAYLEQLQNFLGKAGHDNQTTIYYSAIHGTGITMVPKALVANGFTQVNVVQEQATPDGTFPTVVYPNPEEQEAMQLLLNQGNDEADIMMATDPDTDRVGIAVPNQMGVPTLLNGNQTGALLLYYLLEDLKQHGGIPANSFVVTTIVTSELILEIAKAYGVKSDLTLTGFKYIAQLIREREHTHHFLFGCEESYGYLLGEFVRDKDGISACVALAKMAAWAKSKQKTIWDLLIDIYLEHGFYQEGLLSLTKKGLDGKAQIEAIMKRLRQNPPTTINGEEVTTSYDYLASIKSTDGNTEEIHQPTSNVLQFELASGTKISVRPSGTEPKIKFYFSVKQKLDSKADYEDTLQQLQHKIEALKEAMLEICA